MKETEPVSSTQNTEPDAAANPEEKSECSAGADEDSGSYADASGESSAGSASGTADSVPEQPEVTPAAEKEKPKKRRHSAKYYAAVFFAKLAVTALICWALLTYVAGIYICHSNSSFPMIKDGDFCLTYRLGELKQGVAVVYKRNGKTCFGRVIAGSGDQVEILSDYITVNNYGIYENTVYPTSPEGSKITYPYTVPENCVFVLNDFRNDLNDSRTFGGVPLDDVQGKIVFIMRRRGL